MSNNDEDEETEVFPMPSVPSIHFPPISFNVPSIPIKPTPTGVKCAECAGGVAPPYRPFMDRALMLMSTYGISLHEPPFRLKDLELAIAYSVSVPEASVIIRDLQLKTEYEIQMMNWFVKKDLLLKIEPGIYVHHGMILSQDLPLKIENVVTVPEFKDVERNLLLKTENVTELMTVVERAKNLGLSVEVGIIPTIGVTMDILAGAKVEVELSSPGELMLLKENELETYYMVGVPFISAMLYDGYIVNGNVCLYSREKSVGIKVENVSELTIYPGDGLKYWDASLRLADEYLVVNYKVGGILYNGYLTNINPVYIRSKGSGIGTSVSYGVS